MAFAPAVATETVPCPLCASLAFEVLFSAGDYEYGLPGEFFVSRCRQCGLMVQNPRPAFSEILRYYTEAYEPHHSPGTALVRRLRHRVLVQPKLRLIRSLVGDTGDVIDIGCGGGALLADLAQFGHWRLMGVEPNREAAASARARGLTIAATVVEEAQVAAQSQDVAIMNHVLEHLPDPRETVAHVQMLLRPGGHFIGEVPSPQCAERVLFGRYWGGYHLPRHLTFFSRDQLARFLAQAGFREIRVRRIIQPSSWLTSASNYFRSHNSAAARFVSPHGLILLAAGVLPALALKVLGSAPILAFSCRKPS